MILVTGSTGLVGRHLLLALTETGERVSALYRSDLKKEEVEGFYAFAKAESHLHLITWIQSDITDIPSLSRAFEGITQVYHCAALISFDPYDFKKLTKVNVEGTANVVNLCLAYGIKKIIHLSSIATLASLPNKPIDEVNYWDPDADNSVYALTKYGAEMEVWRGTEEGLNAVIFNPGIIVGEGDYTQGSGTLFKHVSSGKSYYPQGASGIIDVKDLVLLMITAMASSLKQERYVAVGYNLSYQEIFKHIAAALDLKPPSKKLPTPLLKLLSLLDAVRGLFTRKRKITKVGYTSLQTVNAYNNKKLINRFNYTPTPLKITMERIAHHLDFFEG